jgi:hypothetical protein
MTCSMKIASGKFQGEIQATAPSGLCIAALRPRACAVS